MKYLLLIYHEERRWKELSEAERQQINSEAGELKEELESDGRYLGGARLQQTNAAASVRIRDGKEMIIDGPFAETHEQLAGYLLIDVKNVEEAIAVAKRIPMVRSGTIEIRPLLERAAEASASVKF